METRYLPSVDGGVISVQTAAHDDVLLLECREPIPFLRDILALPEPASLPPDTYVRGVVRAGRDAIFQLFDSYGALSGELRFGTDLTRTLLERL